MINAFYDRVERDDLSLLVLPRRRSQEHRRNVATWWCEVFGGPKGYTDQLGGYERMLHKHLRLGITKEQRGQFASLMSLAADDAGMPDDPEFRSAPWSPTLNGERAWPFRTPNSTGSVIEHAPVPRWGWGEAPPYQP